MKYDKATVNQVLKQILFLLTLITLGGFIFFELKFFISGFLGAVTLYVLLRSSLLYLVEKKGWRDTLAATLLTIVAVIALLLLGYLAVNIVYAKVSTIDPSTFVQNVVGLGNKVKEMTGYDIVSVQAITQLQNQIISFASGLVNTTYNVVANLFMTFFLLFFMLANARIMENSILTYMPLTGKSVTLVEDEVYKMILSNAVGIPLVLIAQGGAAAAIYWIFGISDPIFWGFVTGIFGILPVVGTTFVWLPMGVYLMLNDQLLGGLGILICGLVIITNIDNLLRFILMKQMADTHPLVTIMGVILGIPIFGFMGIIFGPLLISVFLLFMKIYRMEYWEGLGKQKLVIPKSVKNKRKLEES